MSRRVPASVLDLPPDPPDTSVSFREAFGIDLDMRVPAWSRPSSHVPERDPNYCFDPIATRAVVAGFAHNRRVLLQGHHGSGKSSHIEQVAARLNWPCLRINLDGHVSRMDLIGKDAIVVRDGKQVTEFSAGVLTWALQRPVALVLDEYDAGRPDVMFVIQRVLEADGRLTLLDQSRVLAPHPSFRLFATANTIGMGDSSGLYHGTQALNQAQLDRWQIVATMDYPAPPVEVEIVFANVPEYAHAQKRPQVAAMVQLAGFTREAFAQGELSTVMSPRTVIHWAQNELILGDLGLAFRWSFLNRCEPAEQDLLAELFQRCFGRELSDAHPARAGI